ncbi:transglycosylase SLT domain-containing protein [Roseococcus sp. YIM B11640]|uniref:transglycosylase SLT domain-containing protein n=1 Tax=Roseococcus sp. YIM B11640 TaxID=3133973 RepID=UPI003C7DD872
MPIFVVRRARRLVRPLAALGVIASLAACGSQPSSGPTASSHHARRSYDPPGPASDPWGPWIREASRRFDVPEQWIRSVMRQESGGRATATSPVGAMGLMQVMPGTYRELQRRHDLGDDPYHPYDNLMAGTAYLREMYNLYGSPAFLAAYNAGPRRLEDYLYNNRGLPAETRNYVARVGPNVIRSSPVRRAPAEVYAAAEVPLRIPAGPRRMDASMQMALAEARQIRESNAQYASLPPAEPRIAPVRGGTVLASAAPSGGGSLAETGGGAVSSSGAVASSLAASSLGGGSLAESGGGRVWRPEGTVVAAMEPIRDSEPAPTPSSGSIVVARMDPIPDGSTPEGAARLAEANSRSERAVPQLVASRPPVAAQPSRFSFIGTANAGTLPAALRPAVATNGNWAVQVGAFTSTDQARRAAQGAQGNLGNGRVVVMPVQVGRATLYRARVAGLSQGSAQTACGRVRSASGCNVIAPD